MRARWRTPSAEPLGLSRRHDHDRLATERDAVTGRGTRNRRAAVLRAAMATVSMALPHLAKGTTTRPYRAPMPVVSTHVDSAIALPPQHAYDHLIREAAERHQVDPVLIKSVMQAESAFNALAVSPAGAQGLMQLMPALAEELGVDDPFDPRQNIMAGAQYLRRLLDRYRGNLRLALAGYNAGPATVSRVGGVPPFPETRKYVKGVTALVRRSRSRTFLPVETR